MSTLDRSRHAFSIGAAAVMLVGCGGSQPPIGALGATAQTTATVTHVDPGVSRMRPGAKVDDLVYAASVFGTVDIITWPSLKLVRRFHEPNYATSLGICSDPRGHVFITAVENNSVGEIFDYAHGQEKPTATLNETTGYAPFDCGSDPTTGNLAVTDWCSGCDRGGRGSVAVFKAARGRATRYTDPNIRTYEYVGYNDKGDMFVCGDSFGYGQIFATLPKGSKTFTDISLNQDICGFGRIQWDGQYMTIEKCPDRVIYRVAVSGSSGTIVGTTILNDNTKGPVGEGWLDLQRSLVIVPESHQQHDVGAFTYPGGDKTTQSKTHLRRTWSVTLSVAPSSSRIRR